MELVAPVFVASSLKLPFPRDQLAGWKVGPSGPVPLRREAQPSLYSHAWLVPSTLTLPNVSITVPSWKS